MHSSAPLSSDHNISRAGLSAAPDRGQKRELFCDAYGPEYCDGIVDALVERLQDLRRMVLDRAEYDVRLKRG